MAVTKSTMAATLAMEADLLLQDIRCAIRGLEDQVTSFEELTTRIFQHVSQTNPSIRKLATDKELMNALLVRAALTLGGRPRTPPTDPFDEATTTSSLDLRQCAICEFKIHRRAAIHIYCGNHHVYCRECLHSAFELATKDGCYDPPRCCDHLISVNEVFNYLPKDLTAFYHAMEKQYIDANMAHNVSNSRHIGGHEQSLKEENEKSLIQLCLTQDWTTCPNCYQMVPLIQQCEKVQCQCGVILDVVRSTNLMPVECDPVQYEMNDPAGTYQAVVQQEPGEETIDPKAMRTPLADGATASSQQKTPHDQHDQPAVRPLPNDLALRPSSAFALTEQSHSTTAQEAVETETIDSDMADAQVPDGISSNVLQISSNQPDSTVVHQHRWIFTWCPKSTCYVCNGRLAFVQKCEGCGIKTCARCRDKAGR